MRIIQITIYNVAGKRCIYIKNVNRINSHTRATKRRRKRQNSVSDNNANDIGRNGSGGLSVLLRERDLFRAYVEGNSNGRRG